MKKVLILASVASMIEQFNMNNIKLLQELGYKVDVAANFENGGTINNNRLEKYKKELKDKNIKYIHIPYQRNPFSKQNLKAYDITNKIINENNYELIHVHSPIAGICGRQAAKKCRKKNNTKVIYTAHGFHFYKEAPLINWIMYYPIEKYFSKYTDCLITINQEDYELAKKKLKAKKTEFIHGVGVDKARFNIQMSETEKQRLRTQLNLNKNDFVIICVAELNKNKNQIMIIEAMKEIVKQYENAKLLLVGKDSMNGYHEEKVNQYGLNKNIKFVGYRTDIPQLLNISDLLVSVSIREGLPVNVIEAMCTGLPVVATKNRGHKELVKDGVNGFLINNNEVEIVEKIEILIENREMLQQLKKQTKSTVKKYLADNVMNEMNKIYRIYEK